MSMRGNRVVLVGYLLALFTMLVIILWASFPADVYAADPVGAGASGLTEIQSPDSCAECHTQEYEAWRKSSHAQAFDTPGFQTAWERTGRLDTCLTCHTTGYDAVTGQKGMAGVTCQACHETEGGKHPTAVMRIRLSSEACGTCHTDTLKEWQLSGHGQRGVECMACHQSHSQTLRIQPANALCGSCHGRRQEDAPHSSHTRAHLTCSSCHMPANPAAAVAGDIGGMGAVGHTFSVGAQTCAQCHEDEIHGLAREMASAQAGSTRLELGVARESQALEAVYERVRILESENQALERKARQQRVFMYVGGAFGFGVGAFVGLIGALVVVYVVQRRGMV